MSCSQIPLWIFLAAQLAAPRLLTAAETDWTPFDPGPDSFTPAELDLRFLNEAFAGENGRIAATNGVFIHSATGKEVRFWAVNGPPQLSGEELRSCARMLAKRGVNLVRIHTPVFDRQGEPDPGKIARALAIVEAMRAEGIYSLFSIYFPLWITPAPGTPWLEGYDGKRHPFAALFFNPAFQAQYRKWWTALLTARNPRTGRTLAEDPAVFALEIQNEDSFFFWTFSEQNLPDPQLRMLEGLFAAWARARHGSLEQALAKWGGALLKRDQLQEGRLAFRPLWAMFNEKTARDQDTARFLLELQMRFYRETHAFLRQLGFEGPITASNWTTASPEVFGPLEKWSYTMGDFQDRHGYFGCHHKGENAEWSIRPGHTYADRSALRFDPETPGQPRLFAHPAMEVHYDDQPSMISETTWNRPNRFRSEAPLYYAAYGALQGTDAVVHFALDGAKWAVKPNFWMQPWTLMSPALMGQFPAAALIYRLGLVRSGDLVAEVDLNKEQLLQLGGTPLPQDAALDELRLKDVPKDRELRPGQRLDPLWHYVGRTQVRFTDGPARARQADPARYIDREAQRVTSSTGELQLDYGRGCLFIDAPAAQGASGCLVAAGRISTRDLVLESRMDLGHVVAVSLDQQPLARSTRILVQAMSEERTTGFATESADRTVRRILNLGQDPWEVRNIEGLVRFNRPDAAELKVVALDHNGYRMKAAGTAAALQLQPGTVYYLVTR